MRFSTSLQFLASTNARMSSSRASYDRNSWRRGFSDRPSGGRDGFVSGDSHLRSVEDANDVSRQVERRKFSNSGGFHQPPPPFHQPPPPFLQPQPFQQPQHFQQEPPFQQPYYFHQQPQHFHQQQSFRQTQPFQHPQHIHPLPFHQPPPFQRPRPFRPQNYKPPDYRNWEYALSQPPSQCERFVVLSYNILADYLAINHRRELYWHIPRHMLDWEWRKRKILFELGLWSADIMCLQEVDRFQDLEEELKLNGYNGIWKMRTGIPVDGCAIFWRTTRFKLLHEESIEYNKFQLRDNVAQICVLESSNQKCAATRSNALPQSSNGANQVVICNTHVLYNHRRGEIKLGQVRMLLDRAHAVSKLWNDAPIILCGDFNCTPKSPLYNFISEQKLDLTGVGRDQISGQSSAQIHTPRPYTPDSGQVSFRAEARDNSNRASMLGDKTEVCMKQSDDLPDMHNQNKPNGNGESTPFTNNLDQSQGSISVDCTSHKSCSGVNYGEEDSAVCDESSKEIEDKIIDSCEKKLSSRCYAPAELFPIRSGNDGVQDLTLSLNSCEDSNFVVDEIGSQSDLQISALIASTMQEGLVCDDMDKGRTNVKEDATSFAESKHNEKLENLVFRFVSDLVPDSSAADENIASLSESLANLSTSSQSVYEKDTSHASACPSPLSLSKLGEDGSVGDACTSSLTSGNTEQYLEKYRYDPSSWTPMEIETASGNADCTLLEHPLKLRSTYAEVEDYSGTRDSSKEPQVTSYNRRFMGTVDYIWCSEGLQTVKVLDTIPKHALQWTPGFPTPKWGSDHIALASQLAFTKHVDPS